MSSKEEAEEMIGYLKKMLEIRYFEEKVMDLLARDVVKGASHLYAGEEAVAVGAIAATREEDYITSTHRGHGHCIAKGARLDKTMAEILGKRTGYCKGKGGSMHIADFSVGMLGATAVVGAGIPIATGAGLSIKLRKTDQVAVCFFGDGASNQGTFHEGLNLAAVWRLPVLFVCENNFYAMGTRQTQVMLVQDVSDRASSYGIPGVSVDGNDVVAVYMAAQDAVKRARKGQGPTLIECKTYRHKGHSRWDPATYRSKEEVDQWLKKDPILRLKKSLLESGQLSVAEANQIEREMSLSVEAAVKFAMDSPYPAPEKALEDVYA
jgi:pyruvate dehydrogenase E1 component alpha subunit